MITESDKPEVVQNPAYDAEYVEPAIESVTTPEDLEREVQYAGVSDGITGIRG